VTRPAAALAATALTACLTWAGSADAAHNSARPAAGSLSERIASSSCYSDGGGQGRIDCLRLAHFGGAQEMLLSPDGRFAYVMTATPNHGPAALLVLRRDAASGALGFVACYGSAPGCTSTRVTIGGAGPQTFALGTGGTFLYLAGVRAEEGDGGGGAPEIATFARNAATGTLAELPDPTGCMVSEVEAGDGTNPATADCTYSTTDILGPNALVAVGGFLYAEESSGGELPELLTFRANADGSLTQLPPPSGCLDFGGSDAGPGPNGEVPCNVWPLTADTRSGGLEGQIAVSPDGRSLYLWTALNTAQPAVYAVNREPASGVLSAGGCAGESAPCGTASLLSMDNNGQALAVSPDSRFVYVQTAEAGERAGQIVTLARTASGLQESSCVGSAFREVGRSRIQLGRLQGCAPAPPTLIGVGGLAMGAGGKFLYAATDEGPFGVSPVDAFARNAATGALRPLAGKSFCIGADEVDFPEVNPLLNGCQQGVALGDLPTLTPDGRELYTLGADITILHPRG